MPPKSDGRMIRRDISHSRKVASLSPKACVLFTFMIPHFNAHGKMSGNPYTIKGEIVPFLEYLQIPDIEACLIEITEKTNVKWFQHEGIYYLHAINWDEHQALTKKGVDRLPSYSKTTPKQLQENSGSSQKNLQTTPPSEVEVEVELEVEVEREIERGNRTGKGRGKGEGKTQSSADGGNGLGAIPPSRKELELAEINESVKRMKEKAAKAGVT